MQANTGAANVDDGCHSALLTSSTAHAEIIENPMPYEVLPRTSSSRWSQRAAEDVDEPEVHVDDEQVVACGCEEDDDQHDDDLAGALEMLPIPCTLSCAPGLPAILLVNPPTEIAAGHDTDDTEPATPASADNQLVPIKSQGHVRHTATSSTLKRLSVTRMNFYMRYLQPKNRRATRRERKATKTLAIVLGRKNCCRLPL